MFVLAITSLLISFTLYFHRVTFQWSYFILGFIILLFSFLYMYDTYMKRHSIITSRFMHWKTPEYLRRYSRHLIFSIILYVSTATLLHTTTHIIVHLCIILGFLLSIFFYQFSVNQSLKSLFKYEEKHLHIMSIIKLYTVFVVTASTVQFTSLTLVPEILSMMIIGILYSWFLLKFRQENQFKDRKLENLFILIPGALSIPLFYLLYLKIFANSFIIACLFALYYVSWGMLKHYLQKDLKWTTILEYILIASLVILIVGIQINNGYSSRIL